MIKLELLLAKLALKGIRLDYKDDDKLVVRGNKEQLDDYLLKQLQDHKTELIKWIKTNRLLKADLSQSLPASKQQVAIYQHAKSLNSSSAYHLTTAILLHQTIDKQRLQHAVNQVIEAHPALKTAFYANDKGLQQQYQPHYQCQIEFENSLDNIETTLKKEKKWFDNPFDVSNEILLRLKIISIEDSQQLMLFNCHHLITDAWSNQIILQDIFKAYHGEAIPDEALNYFDYSIHEQRKETETADFSKAQAFNFIQHSTAASPAMTQSIEINSTLALDIATFSRQQKISNYSIYLSAFTLVLNQLSDNARFIISTAEANRDDTRFSRSTGLFVALVPLYFDFTETISLTELCQKNFQLASKQTELFQQTTPLDIEQTPFLQDVVISYYPERLDNHVHKPPYQIIDTKQAYNRFPLQLSIVDGSTPLIELTVGTEVMQGVFDNFSDYFLTALKSIITAEKTTSTFSLFNIQQQKKIWAKSSGKITESNSSHIIQQFITQSHLLPNSIALKTDSEELSYHALEKQSANLANWIVEHHGRNNSIAIAFERSIELIIAMLAILRSGNSYLPLNADLPLDRKKNIVADANCLFAFANENIHKDTIRTYQLKSLQSTQQACDSHYADIFNILYTSGSSGEPKGVVVSELALRNRLQWMQQYLNIQPDAIFLQKTSIGFDVSVWEIFLPLISGSKLFLPTSHSEKDPVALNSIINEQNISICHFVPSALENFLDLKDSPRSQLKTIILSGEKLSTPTGKKLLQQYPNSDAFNLYGPTEAAIDVSFHRVGPMSFGAESIPIGKAIDNVQLYILNHDKKTTAPHCIGELYIGGVALAEAYLNKPELTQAAFIDNPFYLEGEPSEKLYKTGDYCYLNDNFDLVFVNRIDQQVKIRGQRFELDEISHNAAKALPISTAHCLYHNQQLLLFYISDKLVDKKQAIATLQKQLPAFALPDIFVHIDSWPLNTQGKLDRKKLLAMAFEKQAISLSYHDLTLNIKQIWQRLFKLSLNDSDDFFALGGHSLLALHFLRELQEQTGLEINLETLYLHSSIEALAEHLSRQSSSPSLTPTHSNHSISKQQTLLLKYQNLHPEAYNYNLSGAFHIRGQLHIKRLEQAIRQLLEENPILSSSYHLKGNTATTALLDCQQWDIDYANIPEELLHSSLLLEFKKPFQLAHESALRVKLFQFDDQHYALSFVIHHIACDAWSLHLLYQKVFQNYQALLNNNSLDKTIKASYQQYITSQNSQAKDLHIDFWQKQLQTAKAVTLPRDYPAKNQFPFAGQQIHHQFSTELSQGIIEFCQTQSLTPFIFCLSIYQLLLSKLSHQQDISIALALSGRNQARYFDVIGYFVNTVIVRAKPYKELTIKQYLQQQKILISEVLAHQTVDSEALFNQLSLHNHDTEQLGQFGFNFLEYTELFKLDALADLNIKPIEIDPGISKIDMNWLFSLNENKLQLNLEFNHHCFKQQTLKQWINFFEQICHSVINNSDQAIADCYCLSSQQIDGIIHGKVPNTQHYYPLTPIQKDLYVDSLINSKQQNHTGFYTVSDADADLDIWQESIRQLYHKTDLLRTVICQSDEPLLEFAYQVIQKPSETIFQHCQQVIEQAQTTLTDQQVKAITDHELGKPFNEHLPLWRASTYSFNHGMKLFVFTSHHALFDGINTQLIGSAIKENYQRLISQQELLFPVNNYQQYAHRDLIEIDQEQHLNYWQSQNKELSRFLDYSAVIDSNNSSIKEAFYQSDDNTLAQLQQFCKQNRTTLAHFYKALFALTIRHCHAIEKPYAFVEVTAGRNHDEFFVPGLMFDQQINVIDESLLKVDNVKTWLQQTAKIRKKIKAHGRLSLSRQQAIFSDKIDYIYNFYIMQSETEFLGRKEKIGHLIPRIEGKQNLVVSLVDEQLRLQFFFPEKIIDGQNFLDLLLNLQQEILNGEQRLDALNRSQIETGQYIYLDEDIKPEGGKFYPLTKKDNGNAWQLVNPWHQVSNGTAGNLICLDKNKPATFKAIVRGKQLFVFPNQQSHKKRQVTLPARNTVEALLVSTWQNVLGIDNIDVNDNFFSLGGHSLHAMRIANKLQEHLGISLPIHQVFKHPTISGITQLIFQQGLQHNELPAICPRAKEGLHPVSQSQLRLWLLHKTTALTNEYNIIVQIKISGPLDIDRIQTAYNQLLDIHPALRLSLKAEGLQLQQQLLDKENFILDYRSITEHNKTALQQHLQHVFILDQLHPLFLSSLYHTGNNEHVLSLCIHHMICDAQSLQIITEDFITLYQSSETITENSIDFIDYCHWQEQLNNSAYLNEANDYWLNYLKDVPIELGLKNDYPRTAPIDFSAQQIKYTINAKQLNKLDHYCQKHGISRYILLLFSYHLSLAKHSGNRDIAVGISRDGRFDHSLNRAIGFFINALIIRFIFDRNDDIKTSINRFTQQLLSCYQYEYLHIDQVIRSLKIPRNANLFPIVQAAFNYIDMNNQTQHLKFDGLDIEILNNNTPTARFELVLNSFVSHDELQLIFDYQQSLYKAETIHNIANDYLEIIDSIISIEPCTYQLLNNEQNPVLITDDTAETLTYWQQLLANQEPLFTTAKNSDEHHVHRVQLNHEQQQILHQYTSDNALQLDTVLTATLAFLLQQFFDQGDSFLIKSAQHIYLQHVISGNIKQTLRQQQQLKASQLAQQQLSVYQQEKLFQLLPIIYQGGQDQLSINAHDGEVVIALPASITISHFNARFSHILMQLLQSESCDEISLLLVNETVDNKPVNIQAISLLDSIYRQCKNYGDKTAIAAGNDALSYKQLLKHSHAIAEAIQQSGLTRQSKIAILLPYNLHFIPALLATIHSANIYIPIDTQLPLDRINYLLEDSQADLVISQQAVLDKIGYQGAALGIENIDLNNATHPPIIKPELQDVIYWMYTSGTTGLPKACAIYRHSFEHLLRWYQSTFSFKPQSQSLVFSSASFDLSQKNFFAALLAGGTLHLHDTPYYDPKAISQAISNSNITHINCAPSAFYPLVEHCDFDDQHSLEMVLLGGEAIEPVRITHWFENNKPKIQLVNMYGPTECTDISSVEFINDIEDISLGRAIDGVNLYLKNSKGYILPEGFSGELLIGGIGLSKGYTNNSSLTNDKFIFNKALEQTLYHSGDKALSIDGKYYYQGRIDQQIKINGIRIEPEEIEHAIKQLPGVKQALLIKQQDHFIAFALSDEKNIEQWQQQLQRFLNAATLPKQLMTVQQWPLNANGKVDRQALLSLADKQHSTLATHNDIEQSLLLLWQQVLPQPPQSVHSNFFSEGGDSLSALRLLNLIEQKFSVTITITRLYQAQTIAGQARLIEQYNQAFNPLIELKSGSTDQPIFMIHDITGLSFNLQKLCQDLQVNQAIYGLNAYGFEAEQTAFDNMQALAEFYCDAIIEQQPSGPYRILGLSFGGIICIEIARKLQSLGKDVVYIGLIDSWLPKPLVNINITSDEIRQQLEGLLPEAQLESAEAVQQGFYHMLKNYQAEKINLPLHLFKATQAETTGQQLLLKLAHLADKNRGLHKITDKLTTLEFNSTHSSIINDPIFQKQLSKDLSQQQ